MACIVTWAGLREDALLLMTLSWLDLGVQSRCPIEVCTRDLELTAYPVCHKPAISHYYFSRVPRLAFRTGNYRDCHYYQEARLRSTSTSRTVLFDCSRGSAYRRTLRQCLETGLISAQLLLFHDVSKHVLTFRNLSLAVTHWVNRDHVSLIG